MAGRSGFRISDFGFRICELAQWREVIQNPEGTPVGSSDQIAVLDLEVIDRNHRQVALQPMPVLSVVEAHENPGFRADEKQSEAGRVCADDAADFGRRIVAVDT